jgi:hypothetical protein
VEITFRKTAATAVLGLALGAASMHAHDNGRVRPPKTPANIQAPADQRAFLIAHAIGTQNYMCLPSATTPGVIVWTPVGPQATLFDEDADQLMTHFLSPNPDEGGAARATWQHSRDTSAVWAVMQQPSTDPAYVAPGAIPWLLLRVVGSDEGSNGRGRIDQTKFIQRVNTVGGIAPSTPCVEVGARSFVPYEADYVFYRPRGRDDD